MIWATLSRRAIQASDLVKGPKILLETFIKIQNVERNLTVQCVQLSSSSQSGFLPCYHLKIKGMHPYFFSPGRSCSIPKCIQAQAMGLSYYMEMGKERPKVPSDSLCSFKAPCWKAEVLFDALRLPRAPSQSPLLQQPTVHLSSLPCCKKQFSMVMLRPQCIHFLVLLPSSTLGFLLQELSRDH